MHTVTNVSTLTKMGHCSICGPVRAKFRKATPYQKARWSCMNVERSANDRYSRSYKGIVYEHSRRLKKGEAIPDISGFTNILQLSQEAINCACCGRLKTSQKNLSLDHNHITGEVRGFICQNCNLGLGHFQDSSDILRKAIKYLENPPLRKITSSFFISQL